MIPAKPAWLDDEKEIKAWLHKVVDRLDDLPAEQRSEPLRFHAAAALSSGRVKHGPETDARWELVKSLRDLLPLTIARAPRRDAFAHDYEEAKLVLATVCEETLREWLGRPRLSPEMAAWQAAVDAAASAWPAEGRARLRAKPLEIPGCDAPAVVAGFERIGRQSENLTLRQLSARAFFGDSKFLEGREPLVQALYPQRVLAPRPLLVAIFLPETITGVLFIENQDTYLRAVAGDYVEMAELALVYAAGFKGGAGRIRERGAAVMHRLGPGSGELFEQWWFQEQAPGWPVWFWGDLDFEGLRILKGLRDQFGAGAWRVGYERLVNILRAGGGHLPEMAEKENQRPIDSTGCSFADEVLLAALRRAGRFVDQEAW